MSCRPKSSSDFPPLFAAPPGPLFRRPVFPIMFSGRFLRQFAHWRDWLEVFSNPLHAASIANGFSAWWNRTSASRRDWLPTTCRCHAPSDRFLPCLVVNVSRGGPGLGTIQPSQADYFQSCKGGGHGDYHLIVLAPSSVQEMADFVDLAFELAFKYRNPAMILSDGVIGQMMEKIVLPPFKPRRTEEEILAQCPWAATGRKKGRKPNIITSLELDPSVMEEINLRLQKKYAVIQEKEVRYEEFMLDDAEYAIVAFGSAARIGKKAIEMARAEGIKVGLLRPITIWPFPTKEVAALGKRVKGILSLEINAGQMVEDIRLAVECKIPVSHYGRLGGIIPAPDEVVEALKRMM